MLKELCDELQRALATFNDEYLVKIDESIFEEKKPGFFGRIFGSESKAAPKNVHEQSTIYNPHEQKWHFLTSEEEAFFQNLASKRLDWIEKSAKLKAKDILTKEVLEFSLNSNPLNSILYQETFKDFLAVVNSAKESTSQVQTYFSMLDEILKAILLLEKRKFWALKELRDRAQGEPEMLISRVNELEVVKDGYSQLALVVQKHRDSQVDLVCISLRAFIDRFFQLVCRHIADFKKVKASCEEEIMKKRKPQVDLDRIVAAITEGLAKFESELKSEHQIIRTNFFSLYDADIDKIEVNFNQCFDSLDRVAISLIRYDRSMTDQKVFGLISYFEEVEYYMKKLVSCMKKISIPHVSIFSNLKFSTCNFLTDDQSEKNESEALLNNMKENRESLRIVLEVLKKRNAQPVAVLVPSPQIMHTFTCIFEIVHDLTHYLMKIYEALFQQWYPVSREFKKLPKEKDVAYWRKLHSKFREVKLDKATLKSVLTQREEFEDLNIFVEEVFDIFVRSHEKGVLVADLADVCKRLSAISQASVASLSDLADKLRGVQRDLSASRDQLSQAEKDLLQDTSFEEKHVFVLGDSAKKLDTPTLDSTLLAFLQWIDGLCEVIANRQANRNLQVDDRYMKQLDSAKVNKFVHTKRIHDLIIRLAGVPTTGPNY